METPAAAAAQVKGDEDEFLTVHDLVVFFRRHGWMILALTLAASVGSWFYHRATAAVAYEATATLMVVSPVVSQELKSNALTVQGYQKILESDAVLAAAKKKLVEKGILNAGTSVSLGGNVETRIFTSSRGEDIALAPVVRLVATADTAQRAADIANTWADVFLDLSRTLTSGAAVSMAKYLETEYARVRECVAVLEKSRVETASGYQQRLTVLETRWGNDLAACKAATSDLLVKHRLESQRILAEQAARNGLEVRKARFDATRKGFSDLLAEQLRVDGQSQNLELQWKAAKVQLEQTPAVLTLRKAPPDEVLWQALQAGQPVDWSAFQKRSMLTEQPNPVHGELSARVAQLAVETGTLQPRRQQLDADVKTLSERLEALNKEIRGMETEQEKTRRERDAELAKLEDERQTQFLALSLKKDEEVDSLTRERDSRVSQLTRESDHQKALLDELALRLQQATMLKAQNSVEEIRLGLPAVPPEQPLPTSNTKRVLACAILAFLAAAIGGIVRDHW